MATITIKNIPDDLYAKLKKAAAAHRRSLNSEAIVCLETALTSHPTDGLEAFLARVKARQQRTGMIGLTNAPINKANGQSGVADTDLLVHYHFLSPLTNLAHAVLRRDPNWHVPRLIGLSLW